MKVPKIIFFLLLSSQLVTAQNSYTFTKYFTKISVGDWIQFGQINVLPTGNYVKVKAWSHYGNQLFYAEYSLAATTYANPNLDWVEIAPTLGSGWNGSQNFALDVKYKCDNSCPMQLRLRRLTGGGYAGNINFIVESNAEFSEQDIQDVSGIVNPGFLGNNSGWKFPVAQSRFSASEDGLFIQSNGNVGIGATDAGAKLTVLQSSSSSNPLTASFGRGLTLNNFQRGVGTNAPVLITGVTNANNDGYSGLLMLGSSYGTELANQHLGGVEFLQPTVNKTNGNASSKAAIYGVSTGGGGNAGGYGGMLQFATRPDNSNASPWESVRMVIDQNGYVGIGTATPSEQLSVNGRIRTKEIKVENTNWPDYVFSSSYKLPDLKATEEFIKGNKHLPEMPSAAEVEKNGINLGEMNAKLLKKIEELTLHLIEKDKEIKYEKSVNQSQQNQLDALVKRLELLEKVKHFY